MSGELQPSMGDIRPHGHLKIGRFTQHFVDVLNLEQTPLEFFDTMYPGTPREEQRKYLGRFGVSGFIVDFDISVFYSSSVVTQFSHLIFSHIYIGEWINASTKDGRIIRRPKLSCGFCQARKGCPSHPSSR